MKIFVQMLKSHSPQVFEPKEVEAEEIKSPWAGYRLFVHEAPDRQGLFCVTEYSSGFAVVHYAESKEDALKQLARRYKTKKDDFKQCVKKVILNLGLANSSEDDDLL